MRLHEDEAQDSTAKAFTRLLAGMAQLIGEAGLLCDDPAFTRHAHSLSAHRADLVSACAVLNGIIARLGAEQ